MLERLHTPVFGRLMARRRAVLPPAGEDKDKFTGLLLPPVDSPCHGDGELGTGVGGCEQSGTQLESQRCQFLPAYFSFQHRSVFLCVQVLHRKSQRQ
jgi:hypothetical protein